MSNECKKTTIGGQALIEGVMMRGQKSIALAVRAPNGSIVLETERVKMKKNFWTRCPVVRGAVNFFLTMIVGVKTLLKSAEASGQEDEKPGGVMMFLSTAVGMILAVGLFILLPNFLSDVFVRDVFSMTKDTVAYVAVKSLIEAALRLILFVSYMFLVGLLKDIQRTYMYHGAEHRTISCYEQGMELNVENVQKCSTRHDRCGTSFLFIVMAISILVFTLTNILFSLIPNFPSDNRLISMGIRLLFLPFVAGVSYEILKGLARAKDNIFIRILKAPGLALQKLSTRIPDDGMAEVALTAFRAVLEMDGDESIPCQKFGQRRFAPTKAEVAEILAAAGKTEDSETDWILCAALSCERRKLNDYVFITQAEYDTAIDYANKRAGGIPLARILQKTEFFGLPIKLNDDTLIPRMETELVCEQALKILGDGEGKRVLDLCTGSGCMAAVIAKKTAAEVTAGDISETALTVARENGGNLNISFVQGDMFENIEGKFDLIVCNPPYIKTADIEFLDEEVRGYDPRSALDGGEDGLSFYRILAEQAPDYLNKDGALVLEIGFDQGESVKNIMQAVFSSVAVEKDYSQNPRIIICKEKN